MNKTHCDFPDSQVCISPVGEYLPCCQYRPNPGAHNHITTITEYLESNELQSIKDRLNAGERIHECRYCWRQEDAGFESMRQRKKPIDSPQIREFFIEFGNVCKAACRMCNSARSSTIGLHEKKYKKENPDAEVNDYFMDSDYFITEKFWYKNIGTALLPYVEALDYIQVSGGEPFDNIYFDRFIDTLIASGKRLPDIRITTNGSFSKEQFDKLAAFASVTILLSADSLTRKYYDYLRWPLCYDDLIHAIDIMEKFKNNNNNMPCHYTFGVVMQNLNLLDFAPTIEWFNERFADKTDFTLEFTMINSSKWYHPYNSPKWVREKVTNDLAGVEFHPQIRPSKDQIIAFLDSDQTEVTSLQTLENYVHFTDSNRDVDTWEFLGWRIEDIS